MIDHVSEFEQNRIGNILTYINFSTRPSNYPGYKDVTKGAKTTLNVPDISSDNLFTKIDELQHYSDIAQFDEGYNYHSGNVSNNRHQNPLLYQLVLLGNKISTNANFNQEKIQYLRLLNSQQVTNLLLKVNTTGELGAREIEDPANIQLLEENFNNNISQPNETVVETLNNNIPTTEFSNDLIDTPQYRTVLRYLGQNKLNEMIGKLNRYQKDVIV